jgi:hypothetical protein
MTVTFAAVLSRQPPVRRLRGVMAHRSALTDHPQLTEVEIATARRAARAAVADFPEPVGELINRELHGYADAGDRLPARALAPRLVILLESTDPAEPTMPRPRTLPARYRPGSPLHWD